MIKNKMSEKHRQAIIKANTGRKKSKEEREKISKSLMGHPITEKVREAFRKAGKERFGEKNPCWKGGNFIAKRKKSNTNIRMIRVGTKKYLPEHTIVMENYIGRKLIRNGRFGEVVHHLNGDGLDNRIENLKLFSCNSEHIKEEQRLNFFAKKILYGNLIPDLTERLKKEYENFNV